MKNNDKIEILVDFEYERENLGGREDRDRWSRDSYSYTWSFVGAYPTDQGSKEWRGARDVFCIPKDWVNQELYIVYVIYSTGDSFGYDRGAGLQTVRIYNEYEKAKRLVDFIYKDLKTERDYFISSVEPNFEGEFIYTGSWKGYFESLDRADIETTIIKENNGKRDN